MESSIQARKDLGIQIIAGLVFVSIAQIILVILKLCKVILWNWFWVLSPSIFVSGFITIGFILMFVAFLIINNSN